MRQVNESSGTMTTKWTALGIDEATQPCGRCGKQHLARLVVLEHSETGEIVRVGTTCAARLLGSRQAASEAFGRADLLQSLIDKLRADGLERAKEWSRLRGYGFGIRKIHPHRNIWRVATGEASLIVTDEIVRPDTL